MNVRLTGRPGADEAESRPWLLGRFSLRRFLRGEQAAAATVRLTHRRIFILPNRRGAGLGLLLAVQFLVAINYGNSLAFLLTFLLVGVAVLSAVHAFRNLAGLRVRTGRAAPVFHGEPALFELHVDNPSRLPRRGLHAQFRGARTDFDFEILPASTETVKLAMPTRGRGWLPIATVHLSTDFPLGIFRAWSPLNLAQRVLVYPSPAPVAFDRPPVPAMHERSRPKPGGDEDFFGFQDYRPGDPLKRIHWKGVAKAQGLKVKQYAGSEAAAVDLDWRHTPFADTETRLSVLCRWVLEAERAGTPYRLSLPGVAIAAGLGEAQRSRCLEALAVFGL